ncbi:MAG TPA: AAA family ATPase [Acidimicrobiales bacterium]|nr:AAA family ATPase [Acidimicrobiales bacterium]
MDHALLSEPVQRFVDELTPELERLAASVTAATAKAHQDVTLEAFNIAAGIVDSDGLHTDEELLALVAVFGGRLDTSMRRASPGDLRRAGLVKDKAAWLDRPSPFFEVLVADDGRHGTKVSWRYYELALAIAHAVCSLDAHPSHSELAAVDRFRSMLLARLQRNEVSPPATEPTDAPRPLEELLAELNGLVGLAGVKAEVKLVADLLTVQKLRKERGLPVVETSRHLVFTGNPGTGKTTVARLVAQIYRTLGVVEKGHLVETDRSHLVAGYVGQTATRTREVVEKALGGVLLIDEAYALAQGDDKDFGHEAIATLVKLMEDHRHDLVVIAAGYPDEMRELIESNPGLRSRFPKTIAFPDYTDEELLAIFRSMCKAAAYTCALECDEAVLAFFAAQPRDKGFGNARLARNLFEASVARHASRVVGIENPTNEDLSVLLLTDIRA